MTARVERVYSDTGSELTAAGFTTSIGTPNEFLYDGRYLWVACSTGIAIYEFWGASSNHEPAWETLDELVYPRYDSGPEKKLKLVTFINIGASQIKRATRYASLSVRPDILPSTPDGTVVVGDVSCAVTTINSNLRVLTETSTNTIGQALVPAHLARIGSKIYAVGANFTRIFEFDVDTQRLTTSYTLPIRVEPSTLQVGNSNIVSSGGKLWFLNTFFDDLTPQRLYSWVPGELTMSFTNIPERPASTKQYLADGKNGFVYVTNFNNVSVAKFNNVTGAYAATIRLNAFPTGIWSDENRRILVNSFAGMLSLIDWDDDQVHNSYSTDIPAKSLAIQPNDATKIWWVDAEKLVRYDTSDLSQIETGTVEDWGFNANALAGTPQCIWVSYPQSYQKEDLNTVNVLPYVFVGYSGKVVCFRLDQYWLYRPSFGEHNASGAVVGGELEYFGEV